MCGGFNCLKNALVTLNILYVVVGIFLMYVAWSGQLTLPYLHEFPVVTGLDMCGTFLFGLAFLGLVGAIKHHQVILFFYMIILLILFIAQVIVSITCLSMSEEQAKSIANQSWSNTPDRNKMRFQDEFDCCTFEDEHVKSLSPNLSCYNIPCCTDKFAINCECPTCLNKLTNRMGNLFELAGHWGLLFSITEIFGVWLTKKYRNQKDPRAHPSAFL